MTSVVISERFGGFGVSGAAFKRLREIGVEADSEYQINALDRDDPRLVQVVREMGAEASNRFSNLKVIDIPDGASWHVHEYDGYETLHENHRSWTSDGEQVDCS